MIRPFHSEDASACCRIVRACLQSDASYPLPLRSRICNSETPWIMAERARLFYVAVWEEDGRILGFAGLDLNEIRLLYVDPDFQRRGIGRRLLEHLKAMVPGTLFSEIFVYSTIGAVGFYESCGFKNKGPFIFDVGGISLNTVFMCLPIMERPHIDSRFQT